MDRFLFLLSRNIHGYIHTFSFGFCATLDPLGFFFFGLAAAIELGPGFSISSAGACLLFAWLWLLFDLHGMFAYFNFDLLWLRARKVPSSFGNFC